MPKAIVVGAGPIGMAVAMLLARDGSSVTVLEKDAPTPPADPWEAWERWDRKGVAQFRQPHFMMSRFRHVLDPELPEVRHRIKQMGGRQVNLTAALPRSLPDRSMRPGDERFETTCVSSPYVTDHARGHGVHLGAGRSRSSSALRCARRGRERCWRTRSTRTRA